MEKINELERLREKLRERNINFVDKGIFGETRNGMDIQYKGYEISAVSHEGSYGGTEGLIEIWGISDLEESPDGWLTANSTIKHVIDYIDKIEAGNKIEDIEEKSEIEKLKEKLTEMDIEFVDKDENDDRYSDEIEFTYKGHKIEVFTPISREYGLDKDINMYIPELWNLKKTSVNGRYTVEDVLERLPMYIEEVEKASNIKEELLDKMNESEDLINKNVEIEDKIKNIDEENIENNKEKLV